MHRMINIVDEVDVLFYNNNGEKNILKINVLKMFDNI